MKMNHYDEAMFSAFADEFEKIGGLGLLKSVGKAGGKLFGRGARGMPAGATPIRSVATPSNFVPGRTSIPGFQAARGGRARLHQGAMARARSMGGPRLSGITL